MGVFSQRWESAKKSFETLTGKKKPKPEGLFAKTFNSSGLTKALKEADEKFEKASANYRANELDKKEKAIADAEKYVAVLTKETASYINTLDKAAKDEIAEKEEKTLYARALKTLREELKFIDKDYQAKINNYRVASDETKSVAEKSAAMAQKSLKATFGGVAVAIKSIKASPNLQEWNKFFGASVSDTCARKVQVQLIALSKGIDSGQIVVGRIRSDPREVANMLTPWQAGGKGNCLLPPTAQQADVVARLVEFGKVIKYVQSVVDDLG